MISPSYFDRYSLAVLLPLLMIVLQGATRVVIRPYLPLFLIFVMGVFTVAGTRDYMNRSRVKWKLTKQAENMGYRPEAIDGGHEYNGWHGEAINSEGKWSLTRKKVLVSYSVLDGFRIVAEESFHRPFSNKEHRFYLLEKK